MNVTETASCDQLFRHVCDTLPPTASILPPTAVVDLVRQPEGGLQTPTRFTVANCSLTANRVVTSVPSGSKPAADNAALGDRDVPTHMFILKNKKTTQPSQLPCVYLSE